MINKFKWDISPKCVNALSKDYPHSNCIRFIRNNHISEKDFIPTIIEQPNRSKKWSMGLYGVSLFDNLNNGLAKISNFPYLTKKFKYYVTGNTNCNKGISSACNPTGHINYYLFDYINNSPCCDFKEIKESRHNNG